VPQDSEFVRFTVLLPLDTVQHLDNLKDLAGVGGRSRVIQDCIDMVYEMTFTTAKMMSDALDDKPLNVQLAKDRLVDWMRMSASKYWGPLAAWMRKNQATSLGEGYSRL